MVDFGSHRIAGEEARILYSSSGASYASQRRADERIASQIEAMLVGTGPVLNVGAGTGNYEPSGRWTVSVEPSMSMIGARAAPAGSVCAVAEELPFADNAFEQAMGIFTLHHWVDRGRGLAELARVSKYQLILVYDRAQVLRSWLFDFFPELVDTTWGRTLPTEYDIAPHLDIEEVKVLWVPADCSDGFTGAYWNRPEAYLLDEVRESMSSFARLDPTSVADGCKRLCRAVETGEWDRTYGELRGMSKADLGYRLAATRAPSRSAQD